MNSLILQDIDNDAPLPVERFSRKRRTNRPHVDKKLTSVYLERVPIEQLFDETREWAELQGHKFYDNGSERLVVNHLRHRWSTYDRVLNSPINCGLNYDPSGYIFVRVIMKIMKVYPEFSDECLRQIHERNLMQVYEACRENNE